MGPIAKRFTQLNVRTVSGDGSVTATMRQAGGLRVEIASGMRDSHTGRSLETAITQVLAAAVRGYKQGVKLICEEIPAERAATDPHTPSGKRRAAYLDRIARIAANAESPRGFVEVSWNGDDDIRIELDGNPQSRLSEDALATEVNAALKTVIRARNVEILKSHEAIYQIHRFGKQVPSDARK